MEILTPCEPLVRVATGKEFESMEKSGAESGDVLRGVKEGRGRDSKICVILYHLEMTVEEGDGCTSKSVIGRSSEQFGFGGVDD